VVGRGGGGDDATGGVTAASGGASGAFGLGAGMPAGEPAAALPANRPAAGLPADGAGGAAAEGGAGGAVVGGTPGEGALADGPPAVACWVGVAVEVGGASGVLATGRRGAGDGADGGPLGNGGAEAAGSEALAADADPPAAEPGPPAAEAGAPVDEAGGGGGIVPWPNSAGDAAGEDGSVKGAAAVRYSACARSATRPWVIVSSAGRSGASGLGGTVARLGYASVAPGGGGRCLAIWPPSRSCHQLTGLIDEGTDEHPANTGIALQSSIHAGA
jgi:hypothetical protein